MPGWLATRKPHAMKLIHWFHCPAPDPLHCRLRNPSSLMSFLVVYLCLKKSHPKHSGFNQEWSSLLSLTVCVCWELGNNSGGWLGLSVPHVAAVSWWLKLEQGVGSGVVGGFSLSPSSLRPSRVVSLTWWPQGSHTSSLVFRGPKGNVLGDRGRSLSSATRVTSAAFHLSRQWQRSAWFQRRGTEAPPLSERKVRMFSLIS